MLNEGEYSSSPDVAAEYFSSLSTLLKKKNREKKRFSDEQIRSLEAMFEFETKLEPRKKIELARELGLQPRQVAIWFQNKRARWKSKQLERDYSVLMAKYNSLASKFEVLKKENQSLVVELQKLNDQMEKSKEERRCCGDQALPRNRTDEKHKNGDSVKSELELKSSLPFDEKSEQGVGLLSDDDSSIIAEYPLLDEESDLIMNMVETADGSLTSTENWENLDSKGLLDQPVSSYQWLDFWS